MKESSDLNILQTKKNNIFFHIIDRIKDQGYSFEEQYLLNLGKRNIIKINLN